MRAIVVGIVLGLLAGLGAACKKEVQYYCDEGTPCLPRYPERPYCDLTGAYEPDGVRNTCVANPFDAGVPDASGPIDAEPDAMSPPECGDGTLVPGEVCYTASIIRNTGSTAAGGQLLNLDGDAYPDLIHANEDCIDVFTGGPSGPAAAMTDLLCPPPGNLYAVDLNGDGLDDLVGIDTTSAGSVETFLSDGTKPVLKTSPVDVGGQVTAVAVSDLGGTSRPDVVVGTTTHFVSFINSGDGSIGEKDQRGTSGSVLGLAIADFDEDNVSDVAVATEAGSGVGSLIIQRGLGDGQFLNQLTVPDTTLVTGLVAGDFNDDGHADLAYADESSSEVGFLEAVGGGSFKSAVRLSVGSLPRSLAAYDLNNDGYDDLIVGCAGAQRVDIFLGSSAGLLDPVSVLVPVVPTDVRPGGDVNADGVPEIVVTGAAEEALVVLVSDP